MVAHYEQLRSDVLSPMAGGCPAPGLVLFFRKGMTAWMQAWSPSMKNASETAPPSDATWLCPVDVRAQLAGIMAGMILGQQLEVTR
jgi:hypothetical protein